MYNVMNANINVQCNKDNAQCPPKFALLHTLKGKGNTKQHLQLC